MHSDSVTPPYVGVSNATSHEGTVARNAKEKEMRASTSGFSESSLYPNSNHLFVYSFIRSFEIQKYVLSKLYYLVCNIMFYIFSNEDQNKEPKL